MISRLLVSHDLDFLDNMVTSTLVFEDKNRVNTYVGGYQDWLRLRPVVAKTTPPKAATRSSQGETQKPKEKKLSYKDKRELEELPQRIEQLEAELELAFEWWVCARGR